MNCPSRESPNPFPALPAEPARETRVEGQAVPFSRRIRRIPGTILGAIPLLLLGGIVLTLVLSSGGQDFGLSFFGVDWNPSTAEPQDAVFGILTYVAGSVVTALPALVFALLLSLALAITLVVYVPVRWGVLLASFVDLLAGIPSVVYGIWGFWIVAPFFGTTLVPLLSRGVPASWGVCQSPASSGVGIPLAVFVLTLMIIPLTTLLLRDALRAVPRPLVEAGYALGATRWEVLRRIQIPYIRRAIGSAVLLGFGRAVGETVAVFMVIGDATVLPRNLCGLAYTMPGALVGQLDSAFIQPNYLHALVEMALVLFAITLAVNLLGRRYFPSTPGRRGATPVPPVGRGGP